MSNDDKRGKLLSELRKRKKLTQRDLGDLIGYTDKNISKWERGISFPNNPNIINKLAEIFEISVEELMYGELRVKANETEIRENFANQYKNNYNKYRKNILIIIISFLLFVIISLILIYFIYIKNSISVYSLIIEDNNFDELNSTVVITNKINILNFNKIVNNDNIKLLSLYYEDKSGKKNEVFSGKNENYYIEESRSYDEYFLDKLINNKVYLEVSYENTDRIDVIPISVERKYINDNIFPRKINYAVDPKNKLSNIDLNEKISLLGFENIDGYYEKKINSSAIMRFNIDTMNLIVEVNIADDFAKLNNNYFTDSILCEKINKDGMIENKELNILKEKDCETKKCSSIEDYAMYINYIKNRLKCDMNPVSWTKKRGFYMSKLSYKDKINLYKDKKQGISTKSLSKKYKIRTCLVDYLISLIDKHGYDILRKNKNKFHTRYEKQEAIDRVLLNGESVWSVAIDIGLLNYGMLQNWIKKYKENGYNIVERKRGRTTMPKVTKKEENETKDEKIKRLEEENLYLKAELEYSKKLRAVVQARKNQQQKKK